MHFYLFCHITLSSVLFKYPGTTDQAKQTAHTSDTGDHLPRAHKLGLHSLE